MGSSLRSSSGGGRELCAAGQKHVPYLLLLCGVFLLLVVNGLFWFGYSDRTPSLFLAGALIIVGVLALVFAHRRSRQQDACSRAYLVVLLGLGVCYSLAFSPFSVPDEDFHFSASYSLSNFIMGKGYQSEDPVPMRVEDARLFDRLSTTLGNDEYEQMKREFSTPLISSAGDVDVETGRGHSISGNPPQAKIASAIGITLARVFSLGPLYLFYFGRFANLALYAVLVYLACRITPVGKNVLMAISLLPMSIHLAASYSYDSFIIPMSLLLLAECLRAIKSESRISACELIQITITAALLAPCKVIYALIALFALFIPSKRFSSVKKARLTKLGCFVLVAAVLVLIKLGDLFVTAGVVPTAAPNSGFDYRGDEVGHFYSVFDVFAAPIKFVIVLLRTLDSYGYYYLSTMLGGSLGWFQAEIVAPGWLVVAYVIVVLVSAVASADDAGLLSTPLRVAGIAIVLIGSLAVFASMLFGFTFNTEQLILGVQGRYFLPYLPVLLLAIRPRSVFIGTNIAPVLLACLYCADAMYLVRIFSIGLTL